MLITLWCIRASNLEVLTFHTMMHSQEGGCYAEQNLSDPIKSVFPDACKRPSIYGSKSRHCASECERKNEERQPCWGPEGRSSGCCRWKFSHTNIILRTGTVSLSLCSWSETILTRPDWTGRSSSTHDGKNFSFLHPTGVKPKVTNLPVTGVKRTRRPACHAAGCGSSFWLDSSPSSPCASQTLLFLKLCGRRQL